MIVRRPVFHRIEHDSDEEDDDDDTTRRRWCWREKNAAILGQQKPYEDCVVCETSKSDRWQLRQRSRSKSRGCAAFLSAVVTRTFPFPSPLLLPLLLSFFCPILLVHGVPCFILAAVRSSLCRNLNRSPSLAVVVHHLLPLCIFTSGTSPIVSKARPFCEFSFKR